MGGWGCANASFVGGHQPEENKRSLKLAKTPNLQHAKQKKTKRKMANRHTSGRCSILDAQSTRTPPTKKKTTPG
eukprot:4038380-Karenia_brevis.AAC.1